MRISKAFVTTVSVVTSAFLLFKSYKFCEIIPLFLDICSCQKEKLQKNTKNIVIIRKKEKKNVSILCIIEDEFLIEKEKSI